MSTEQITKQQVKHPIIRSKATVSLCIENMDGEKVAVPHVTEFQQFIYTSDIKFCAQSGATCLAEKPMPLSQLSCLL